MENQNTQPLGDELAKVLADELERALPQAGAELRSMATRIAANAAAAAATGRTEIVEECRAQAIALAEVQRLRLAESEWAVFSAVIGSVVRSAAAGLAFASSSSSSTDGVA